MLRHYKEQGLGERSKYAGCIIKQNMIDMGLAENVFKANISEIKNKYKNNDIPDWLLIEKNKYIRVK